MPLDRTGEPIEPDTTGHRPGIDCAGGWLPGHTLDDDQPRPCPVCKPHLTPEARRRRCWGVSDPGPIRSRQPHPEKPPTSQPEARNGPTSPNPPTTDTAEGT